MRGWITVSFMLIVAGLAAGSCASGGQLASGAGDTTSGGTAGGSLGRGGATSGSSSSTTATTSSASGGGGTGGKNPCEGVPCNTPPPSLCSGADLVIHAQVGTCSEGQCTYNQTTQACPNGCANAMCNGDPCLGVTCNSPPPATCANATTLDVPQAPGTCNAGACSYASTQINCAFGCTGNQCANDPCAGVTCNQPAASFCVDATHLRVRDLPGACDAANSGACAYTTHDELCAFGCVNGACSGDPCVGVVCPPKASYCSDASTLVHYDAGQCTTGLPCTYGSMSTPCANGCVNGQCVVCTTSSQCAAGNWCNNHQCLSCNTDLHCGPSCVACGGATPKCSGATCVQCVGDADCGGGMVCSGNTCVTGGCTPPTSACTTSGSQDGNCANAYVISRTAAGAAAGFVVNNTYGLCNRTNDFTDNTCGGGTGSDAAYKLFMRQGETANIQLTRGSATCTMGWGGAISLKIFEAPCDASCNCSTTTCSTRDYCVQSNNQNPMFVAPKDGWYTIVVDSVGPVDDKGGVFYLSVKLACAGGSCACM